MLLPYLLAGLGGGCVPDYRAATYMVVGQLAARATFTADLATGAQRAPPAFHPLSLLLLLLYTSRRWARV